MSGILKKRWTINFGKKLTTNKDTTPMSKKPSERITEIVKDCMGLWPSDTFYPPAKSNWEVAIMKYLDEQEEKGKE